MGSHQAILFLLGQDLGTDLTFQTDNHEVAPVVGAVVSLAVQGEPAEVEVQFAGGATMNGWQLIIEDTGTPIATVVDTVAKTITVTHDQVTWAELMLNYG